ncbi:sulfite exporter TauE/SafE family protein [Rossellomorea vietnamensis]|uniref:Probable membrane transporter protein n=1 Tax=Rossellomorea vietnamensis TaxID=218284 RepID=A0A5D4M0X7_9BACI|nr:MULTISPECIES: sulfite exporter TauE/SafE family protein [Bacillaceae]TYR95182.1 sulfite exporter TauE/SafE family protein [Rossellomorea vietnamensis]
MFFLLFTAGFFTALIGTIAGSGGLIGLPVMLLSGLPIHSAIAVSKFSNTLSSFSSFAYLLKKREIRSKEALSILPFAFGGGIAGGLTAGLLSQTTLEVLAIIFLTTAFSISFIKKPSSSQGEDTQVLKCTGPYLTAIGFYDGMFGPGQATILMHTFLSKGISYIKSIAFTRFQTFISCSAAFTAYLYNGHFIWQAGLAFCLGSLLGAQIAVRTAEKIPLQFARVILNAMTLILITKLIHSLLF